MIAGISKDRTFIVEVDMYESEGAPYEALQLIEAIMEMDVTDEAHHHLGEIRHAILKILHERSHNH